MRLTDELRSEYPRHVSFAGARRAPAAGIEFGPANKVSNSLGCDEGIMGNNEVSPVATTLGQPNGSGGFVTLPTPVKHVFVIHDDALLNRILIGRRFPVAFGPPIPNVSDPSGLNCVDLPVADLGSTNKTGANFPTMAIDKAGNLYAVWSQAPINGSGQVIGDTVLKDRFRPIKATPGRLQFKFRHRVHLWALSTITCLPGP